MEKPKDTIKTHPIATVLVLLLLGSTAWLVYDLLFDSPEIHEGIIVSMEYIPGKMQSGQYHMGSRSRPQLISSTARDRWLATVKMNNGDFAKVDCKRHHFENKKVGAVLRFKEFGGGSLGIQYFSHSEEEQ